MLVVFVLYLLKLVFLLWVKSFPTVLSALMDTFRSEFLNSLVMNFGCRPMYVNLAHFVFAFLLASMRVFVSVLPLILFKIFTSYSLLFNICFIV